MRRFVYSKWLKLTAVILIAVCMVLGMLKVSDGIVEYCNEEIDLYSFENDFSDIWYISALLNEPENAMFNAYNRTFYQYDDYGNPVRYDASREELAENIRQWFSDFYNSDKLNYYVKWNELVLTNCGAESAEELMQGDYYSCISRDSAGRTERISSAGRKNERAYLLEDIEKWDTESEIVISCNIKEETVREYQAIWEKQERIVFRTFVHTLLYVLVALLLYIYLICVCGRDHKGEQARMWLDNLWVEVHLTAIAGFGTGAALLCAVVLDAYTSGHFPLNLISWVVGAAGAIGSLVIITASLSIIRNIKHQRLMCSSILLRALKWSWHLTQKAAKWMWRKIKGLGHTAFRLLSKKTGMILISLLLGYTVLIGIFGIITGESPLGLVLGILLFCVACFFVACRANDLEEIKKGVGAVCGGDLTYKIPRLKSEDMAVLADNINDIARGLDESVSEKVKAERLKTELITNVSHDLKTPITSIISYTELLSKLEAMPEEARDYISVIAQKSERLKRLTQDLFDISKVQSGNDDVIREKLDAALLIHQAMGEYDKEIRDSGLPFCVEVSKELYISADGRKMSRVLSNLLQNILKYTMKNTRVFITAEEKDGNVEMVFKNISAYPLKFNVEEITQRFVRGDEARTTEGHGLGLAIAKSYTEVCGGSFEILTDGDMFKAILRFSKYSK